jgi:hypothetical protein
VRWITFAAENWPIRDDGSTAAMVWCVQVDRAWEVIMNKSTYLASITIILSAVCAMPALADVPPPDGYVETCTVAKRVTATTECLTCAAYYGAVSRCQTMLAPYCYSKACQSSGASTWTEVHCRTKNASAPVVPQEVTSVLSSASVAPPSVPTPATCPPDATTTDTATATATDTTPEKKNDSGCSLGAGHAVRTLGPWTLVLAGLLLVTLRRRRG